jgi:hypothetical protein
MLFLYFLVSLKGKLAITFRHILRLLLLLIDLGSRKVRRRILLLSLVPTLGGEPYLCSWNPLSTMHFACFMILFWIRLYALSVLHLLVRLGPGVRPLLPSQTVLLIRSNRLQLLLLQLLLLFLLDPLLVLLTLLMFFLLRTRRSQSEMSSSK